MILEIFKRLLEIFLNIIRWFLSRLNWRHITCIVFVLIIITLSVIFSYISIPNRVNEKQFPPNSKAIIKPSDEIPVFYLKSGMSENTSSNICTIKENSTIFLEEKIESSNNNIYYWAKIKQENCNPILQHSKINQNSQDFYFGYIPSTYINNIYKEYIIDPRTKNNKKYEDKIFIRSEHPSINWIDYDFQGDKKCIIGKGSKIRIVFYKTTNSEKYEVRIRVLGNGEIWYYVQTNINNIKRNKDRDFCTFKENEDNNKIVEGWIIGKYRHGQISFNKEHSYPIPLQLRIKVILYKFIHFLIGIGICIVILIINTKYNEKKVFNSFIILSVLSLATIMLFEYYDENFSYLSSQTSSPGWGTKFFGNFVYDFNLLFFDDHHILPNIGGSFILSIILLKFIFLNEKS